MKIQILIKRPVCRVPIKPKQSHKIATRYQRKPKHRNADSM